MTGIDEGYTTQAVQHYGFQMRAAKDMNSDEEIWQALAERDDVAVVTSIVGGETARRKRSRRTC